MPTPTQKIKDILASAKKTQDAATVITLYADHLEALLRAQHAATPQDPAVDQEEWSAESSLAANIDEIAEALADASDDDLNKPSFQLLSTTKDLFEYLCSLLELQQHVEAGERGLILDETIRELYDVVCWVLEESPLDESVPAAQIVRHLFGHPLRNADTFLRGCIRANQDADLLDEAEKIAEDEFDQRFTPPSLRESCWSACARPGMPRRTGIRRTSSPARWAGSARRRPSRPPS